MNDSLKFLSQLRKEDEIGIEEFEFARFLVRMESDIDQEALLTFVLAVHDQLNGNICTNLTEFENSKLASRLGLTKLNAEQLITSISKSDLLGAPDEYKPLILEEDRLYLHKYWNYEQELINWLIAKSKEVDSKKDFDQLNAFSHFWETENEFDPQQIAVALAVLSNFLIISGGPGTGKTYTIKQIIKALFAVYPESSLALAAPTGKAAERLNQSIGEESEIDAVTIHRLLGARMDGSFSFTRDKKLAYDVVIVDEASMLDIRLWVGLIRAVRKDCKLILLGDKDQLSSVEAGSVLGDICFDANNSFTGKSAEILKEERQNIPEIDSENILNNHIVLFKKSYRAEEGSGITEFANAINAQQFSEVKEIEKKYDSLEISEPSSELITRLIDGYSKEIVSGENRTQFICSNRNGTFGTRNLNINVEESIKRHLKISANKEWYSGRKILITKNDYQNELRNGEIGICKITEEGVQIHFSEERILSADQLKSYELAYAITVHKSQGSEFDHIKFFLAEKENPVLSKELLYTAVTRARLSTLVIGSTSILKFAIEKAAKRSSGISNKLTSIV